MKNRKAAGQGGVLLELICKVFNNIPKDCAFISFIYEKDLKKGVVVKAESA